MSVQSWTFLLVAASFTLYIGIAVWSRATSTKDFYVAGAGVSPLANGMATAADWMSAASFISMAGLISFMGYDGAVYLMGWTGGYVLLALLLATYGSSEHLRCPILSVTGTTLRPQELWRLCVRFSSRSHMCLGRCGVWALYSAAS